MLGQHPGATACNDRRSGGDVLQIVMGKIHCFICRSVTHDLAAWLQQLLNTLDVIHQRQRSRRQQLESPQVDSCHSCLAMVEIQSYLGCVVDFRRAVIVDNASAHQPPVVTCDLGGASPPGSPYTYVDRGVGERADERPARGVVGGHKRHVGAKPTTLRAGERHRPKHHFVTGRRQERRVSETECRQVGQVPAIEYEDAVEQPELAHSGGKHERIVAPPCHHRSGAGLLHRGDRLVGKHLALEHDRQLGPDAARRGDHQPVPARVHFRGEPRQRARRSRDPRHARMYCR